MLSTISADLCNVDEKDGSDSALAASLSSTVQLPGGPATSPGWPQETLGRDAGSRPLAQTAQQSLSEPFDSSSQLGICGSSSDAEENHKRQELTVPYPKKATTYSSINSPYSSQLFFQAQGCKRLQQARVTLFPVIPATLRTVSKKT